MQTKKYVILFQFSFIYLKTLWYMFGTKVPEFFHKVSIHCHQKLRKKKRKNFFTEDKMNMYLKVRHGHSVGHVLTGPLHF